MPVSRRRARKKWQVETAQAWLYLLPVLFALVVLRFYPVVTAVKDSFDGPNGLTLKYYRYLFGSAQFHHSLVTTLIFNAIVNPFQILVALALAMLLRQKLPARGLLRALIFAPVAMPVPVAAVVWGQLFAQNGAANGFLRLVGIPPQGFLTSQHEALLSIVVLASWIGVGFWMVFLIAGLNEIPTTLYDAAAVDGAGALGRFWYVALPLLRRPLVFVLVADTVANLVLFTPIQILTSGGPLNTTDVLMYDVYNEAYLVFANNVAAAETLVLVVISLMIVTLEFRFLRARA